MPKLPADVIEMLKEAILNYEWPDQQRNSPRRERIKAMAVAAVDVLAADTPGRPIDAATLYRCAFGHKPDRHETKSAIECIRDVCRILTDVGVSATPWTGVFLENINLETEIDKIDLEGAKRLTPGSRGGAKTAGLLTFADKLGDGARMCQTVELGLRAERARGAVAHVNTDMRTISALGPGAIDKDLLGVDKKQKVVTFNQAGGRLLGHG